MKKTKPIKMLLMASLIAMSGSVFAQVKIGTNPTVISSDVNLDVEAANGYHTVVGKTNGRVGVNTDTPQNLLHVSASSDSQGLLVDLKNGTSSVYATSDGGITIKRVGSSKTFAPHVGGYLDLIGQTGGSPGWRFAQYATFLGIGPVPESNINNFPMYIYNDGHITMGSSAQLGGAKLSVSGQIAAQGFCTRSGSQGAINGNNFNISWNGSQANLWIDNLNFGVISLTSDYRLKKNVNAASNNAIERVKRLRPVSFEYKSIDGELFKSDSKIHEGFIAHELQAVIPSAVNGEKDGVTKEGKIQPQTLNAMPVISLLTKAIQEQQTEIDALKFENVALKAQSAKVDAMVARLAQIESKLLISNNVQVSNATGK